MSSSTPGIQILPPTYQSGNITLPQWVSLITLGSAPLIAHIISGAPEPTYLCRSRPKWVDRACLYCPLTILWRYMAIADRRIRAREWSPADMAAANAIFWTPAGWDGSEEVAVTSLKYCDRLPKHTRLTMLSWDSLKTIVTTLQGVQCLYNNAPSLQHMGHVQILSALPRIASAVAVLGLLRLSAAFWISNDFSYLSIPEEHTVSDSVTVLLVRQRAASVDSFQMLQSPAGHYLDGQINGDRFFATSIASRIFRTLVIAFFSVLCLIGVAATFVSIPGRVASPISTTSLIGILMVGYTGLLSTVLYTYHSVRYGCQSTMIPCISAKWYKVICILYFVFWAILFTFSAVETRETPCGVYTTSWPGLVDDSWACPGLAYVGGTEEYKGLARAAGVNETEYFRVTSFTGTCQGKLGGE